MTIEEWLAEIIKSKSISVVKMARDLGLNHRSIYNSLCNKNSKRELRSSELVAICRHINADPMNYLLLREED